MMERLEARARRAAEARVASVVDRVAERVREGVPGADVAVEEGRVVLSGRGLRRRLLRDAALRWIGGLLR